MTKLELEGETPSNSSAKHASASSSEDLARLGPVLESRLESRTFTATSGATLRTGAPLGVAVAEFSARPLKPSRWTALRWISRTLLFVGIMALVSGARNKGELPTPSEILPAIKTAPRQSETERAPFTFTYRGGSYRVTPRAEYELYGVVVTHNNISGIGDAYHTSDSVDMKDVCVVWGTNVLNDNYRMLDYTSEPWTCVVNAQNQDSWRRFFTDELSNNHLLAGDGRVQERIRSVRVGDQIHLTGMLVDYTVGAASDAVDDAPNSSMRASSLVRTDTGNGACEVLFVEHIEILKRATPGWYGVYAAGWYCLALAVALRVYVVVRAPIES